MKRRISLLLFLCLLLNGCSVSGERIKDPVTFYYVQSEFAYFSEDGVIASEEREASGHTDELSYLLALYLMGPSDEKLTSPLPRNCTLHHAEISSNKIVVQLSNLDDTLSDYEYSLACACLALTCFDITQAQMITIHSGERTVEMNRKNLSIYDSHVTVEEHP